MGDFRRGSGQRQAAQIPANSFPGARAPPQKSQQSRPPVDEHGGLHRGLRHDSPLGDRFRSSLAATTPRVRSHGASCLAHPWIRPPEKHFAYPSVSRRSWHKLLRGTPNHLQESALARAIRSRQHPQPICTTHHNMDGAFRPRGLSPLALPRLAHCMLFPAIECVPRRYGGRGARQCTRGGARDT